MSVQTTHSAAVPPLRGIGPAQALRLSAALFIGGAALLLGGLAACMTRAWTDRHLLPDILVPSEWLMTIVQIERATLMAITLALLIAAHWVKAGRGDRMWRAIVIGIAILLAVPASEAILQQISWRKGQPWTPGDEPLRRVDPRLGWTYVPSRLAADPEFAWHPLYRIDSHGYRIAPNASSLDRTAPSILFVGESIMFGKGLEWKDSVAGRVQASSGIQSANLAVNAYSVSQSFLKLQRDLPRFRHPVAVVILFSPSLMVRDLDRNRPWIDSAGQWHRAEPSWALGHLGRILFPCHSRAAIAHVVAIDRRLLMAAVAMVRTRGARPLILVPAFQPDGARERALRVAIFDGSSIPHLVVPLDPDWRLPHDSHPDARGNAAMAHALWARLKD
ncbi:hypothetical protein [Sphingobium sp. Sx8-8]|uniref:hypothetical protein n=1 Tax=Sphingobium sp. Sx8-8 TaxID=2933617 RepID=UPI001F56FA2E|nr:hypothetical protein [Sphingobium sp. Sx8-8]